MRVLKWAERVARRGSVGEGGDGDSGWGGEGA